MAATAGLSEWAEWVRTGGMIGLLMLAAKLYTDNRKLRLAEKVSDREGWGQLIGELREEVTQLRNENAALRKEVHELHGLIDGMRRQGLSESLSRQRAEIDEGAVSPVMRRALGALRDVSGDKE